MLSRLIQFSLSQRLLISLLSLLLIGFGNRAMLNLPIDAFPDISPTQVKLIIKSPGMTPEEVESLITQPIEVELLGIPDQIRPQRHHPGLRRGNRHLLGPPAGYRAVEQYLERSARQYQRGTGPHEHTAQ